MGFKDEALYTFAPQPYGDLFVMRNDGTQVEQLTDNQWEGAGPSCRRGEIDGPDELNHGPVCTIAKTKPAG